MTTSPPASTGPVQRPGRRSRLLWVFAAGGLVLALCAVFRLLPDREQAGPSPGQEPAPPGAAEKSERAAATPRMAAVRNRADLAQPVPAAERIVAGKVAQFVRGRREVVRALAQKLKVNVPADVAKFFDLAEAGNWDDLREQFENMDRQRSGPDHPRDLDSLWPAVAESYGVARVAHTWPAQRLLDYGRAVLDSLRPGMVYFGGTDPGRFVPTLLNETAGEGRHVVLTQDALADTAYLDYASFLYGDQLSPLTSSEAQRALNDYLADARKRAQHDQQVPGEPRQLKPGEIVRTDSEGGNQTVQVTGPTAVRTVNEQLLLTLLQKNPNTAFALEASFPLDSACANATPLGPLLELHSPTAQTALTAETVAQSAASWQATAQQWATDPAAATSDDVRGAWASLATAQANLFAARNFTAAAEQTYRAATQLAPGFLESAGQYARFLFRSGRPAQGHQVLDDFAHDHPAQFAAAEALRANLIQAAAPEPVSAH